MRCRSECHARVAPRSSGSILLHEVSDLSKNVRSMELTLSTMSCRTVLEERGEYWMFEECSNSAGDVAKSPVLSCGRPV